MNIKNNLPDPVTRREQYLNYMATGEGEIPEYPIFREEFYLAYLCEHGGGGFTPTEAQLNAMNSGITSSDVARMLKTPIATPLEKLIVGVDTSNAESLFGAGVGIELSGSTSPFDIDVVGFDYSETEPTEDNTNGLKVVHLTSEPATKYDGWLYLIDEE